MDNQHFFLGIDVAKENLVVAISETQTKPFKNTALGISRLVKWAGDICDGREPWFVMESSGAYSTITWQTRPTCALLITTRGCTQRYAAIGRGLPK